MNFKNETDKIFFINKNFWIKIKLGKNKDIKALYY